MTISALIIDDEPDIRELLEITLGRMGLETSSAATVTEAKEQLAQHDFSICLTDMRLPDGSGLDIVAHIQQHKPEMPVAVITAHGSMDTAIESMKAGAFDFLSKPVDLVNLRSLITTALKVSKTASHQKKTAPTILGESAPVQKLLKQVSKVARSQAPIFINGESGTGKELVARAIHYQGPRAEGPFIPVNCGAIPSELMESEFFGHTKGSFTGASNDKQGLFQAAHGGTLFLDEVADLPLDMQVKLLRAIQEKAVRAVGSQEEKIIDVRILSATHKDLPAEIETGRFRNDLFYRINVIQLSVPALRERSDDIALLCQAFLQKFAQESGLPEPKLNPQAQADLANYPFPGNIRELENILERAYTLCEDDTITADDLHLAHTDSKTSGKSEPAIKSRGEIDSLDDYLEDIEKDVIIQALEESRWNRTATAKKLGLSFRSLRYRLKKLGLDESSE